MNLFQRIHATFTSTVSQAVSHVENHDAVAEAALKDTHAAAARARVRLSRLMKEGEAMRRRREELARMESVWAERAVASAKEDEARALECVSRRNACREQLAQLTHSLARHEEVEREVSESVSRIEQRVRELSQQISQLRSRHSAADALRVIHRIEGGSAHGIEDIFDRWEMKIAETEYVSGGAPASDALDASFARKENETALRAELEALLSQSATNAKE